MKTIDHEGVLEDRPEQGDTIEVPAQRLAELRKAAEALVRRARRAGVEEAAFEVGPELWRWREHQDPDGSRRRVKYRYHEVRILAGAPIKVSGWTFCARLEPLATENLVHRVPGWEGEIHERFRTTTRECAHCRTARWRKELYVLQRDEDGEQVQVGSTCLRDFLGCDTPASLAARFRWLRSFRELGGTEDDWFGGRWGEAPVCSLGYLLLVTTTVIRTRGWVSRAQADKSAEWETPLRATSGLVLLAADPHSKEDHDWARKLRGEQLPADEELALAAARWARDELEPAPGSDYERNLRLLARECEGGVYRRHFGLCCSMVSAYARARGLSLGPEREAKSARWLGEVGARLRAVDLEITDIRQVGEGYGYHSEPLKLVKMRTEDGAVATWFTSAYLELQVGSRVRVTGTVKKLTEFKGAKETQLSRCVLVAQPKEAVTCGK